MNSRSLRFEDSIRIVMLFLLVLISVSIEGQVFHLDVEGNAKIRGLMDFGHEIDETSLYLGILAGTSLDNGSFSNTVVGPFAGQNLFNGNRNSFFGYRSGFSASNANNNSFFGYLSGENTIGNGNSFFGFSSGSSNTNGAYNSFFGQGSGSNNNSGMHNSFYGSLSGNLNSSGNENSFFGSSSGTFNSTGSQNSFFGCRAGEANMTGSDNSFFGKDAGWNNSIGSRNSFFGRDSGFTNTTGNDNSFFGESSGQNNLEGEDNSFYGNRSGISNSIGDANSFYGMRSGQANTIGSFNTFVGFDSGTHNETGSRNTYIGHFSGSPSGINLSRAIAIGNNASVECNDCAVIGGTGTDAVKVGIGTSLPAYDLEVTHGSSLPSTSGSDDALSIKNGGSGNAWQFHTNGTDGWLSLYYNTSYRGGFNDNTGVYTEVSDRRFKKDIQKIPEVQMKLLQELRPVSYEMKDQKGSERHYGLIAQEVLEVYPEIVHKMITGEGEMLSLSYTELIPLLIKGMQEQQVVIASQTQKLDQVLIQLSEMRLRIISLENRTTSTFSKE